jgi:polyhydroxyalkanoate synthesis repressor PhaR
MTAAIVIKKYGNRRLYDTAKSAYVTQEQVADTIRAGHDVRVVDAKTGQDLTQSTLVQLILESRGAARLLPVPLLVQLVRMGDDALAEFFGQYVQFALEAYLQAKRGVQAISPYNPFAGAPFDAGNALARMLLGGQMPWGGLGGSTQAAPSPQPTAPTPAPAAPARDDVAEMRRELEELKKSLRRRKR